MCEYCEKDNRKRRSYFVNDTDIMMKLDKEMNNNLHIKFDKSGTIVELFIPANYCPMCGRALNYVNK